MRVFRNYYICDECNNTEWQCELVTTSADWCPCCDQSTEPYDSIEYEIEEVE